MFLRIPGGAGLLPSTVWAKNIIYRMAEWFFEVSPDVWSAKHDEITLTYRGFEEGEARKVNSWFLGVGGTLMTAHEQGARPRIRSFDDGRDSSETRGCEVLWILGILDTCRISGKMLMLRSCSHWDCSGFRWSFGGGGKRFRWISQIFVWIQ